MISLKLKSSLLICACIQIGSVFFAPAIQAQDTSELGIALGGAVYKGELAPDYRLANNRPAGALFYKKGLSPALDFRVQGMLGFIRAKDEDLNLPLHIARDARMAGRLLELSAGIDYNFLDFYNLRRYTRWTPYYFVGVAATSYSVTNNPQESRLNQNRKGGVLIAIPTGVGVKLALSYHWNLGLEVGARKSFTDKLDAFDETTTVTAFSNPFDRDWYFFNGVTLSYTFYKIKCPQIYRSSPGLLY
jgi:hypothetical protein